MPRKSGNTRRLSKGEKRRVMRAAYLSRMAQEQAAEARRAAKRVA